MVFRPREKERYKLRKHRKNDKESFLKLKRLQIHQEYVKHLFKLVIKRERLKRLKLDYDREQFDQAVFEATNKDKKKQRTLKIKPRKRSDLDEDSDESESEEESSAEEVEDEELAEK